jgi:hypothetical protein
MIQFYISQVLGALFLLAWIIGAIGVVLEKPDPRFDGSRGFER